MRTVRRGPQDRRRLRAQRKDLTPVNSNAKSPSLALGVVAHEELSLGLILISFALYTVTLSALPVSQPNSAFSSVETRADSGPGIDLINKSGKKQKYFFYDNYWNGHGAAGANSDKLLKSVTLNPGASQSVPLATAFKGRVQRGKDLSATWVEFQIQAADDGGAHGDISLQQSCDGAATIVSTFAPIVSNRFTNDVSSLTTE